MLRKILCGLILAPFLVLLAIGAAIVAVALFAIYQLADAFYPLGAEWSA